MAKVNNGNGVLFRNQRKEQPQHPDYTGNFTLTKELAEALLEEASATKDGYKVQLAAWVKEGPKGKYMSVSVSAPFKKSPQTRGRFVDDDKDPPF